MIDAGSEVREHYRGDAHEGAIKSVKILVAGTGSIGRRHIRSIQALHPTARFVLLRRDAREDEFSRGIDAQVVARVDAALAAAPECAVIATPSSEHAALVVELLGAGLPMYVEKPVVASRAQVEQVADALRGGCGPICLAGCNLRFLPSLQKARDLVREGHIGKVARASLQVGQWLPDWRLGSDYRQSYSASLERGGGVVLDLVHELDAARWIFGEFAGVFAFGGRYSSLELQTEDSAVIGLSRPEGPAVGIGLDYVSRVPMRRYEFIGDEATLVWDLPMHRLEIHTPGGIERPALPENAFDVAGTYLTAMREFMDALGQGRSPSQDLAEGLKSAELAIRVNELIRS